MKQIANTKLLHVAYRNEDNEDKYVVLLLHGWSDNATTVGRGVTSVIRFNTVLNNITNKSTHYVN